MRILFAFLLITNICFGQGNFNGKAANQLLNAWDINNSTSYGFTLTNTPNNSWHIARKDSVIYWYGTHIDTVNNLTISLKAQNQSISKRDLSVKFTRTASLYPKNWQVCTAVSGLSGYPSMIGTTYCTANAGSINVASTTITGWNNGSNVCSASPTTGYDNAPFQVGWNGLSNPTAGTTTLTFYGGSPVIDTTYNNGAYSYGWFYLYPNNIAVELRSDGLVLATYSCGSAGSTYTYTAQQYSCGACTSTGRTVTVQSSSNSLTNGYYYSGTGGFVYKITSSASSGTSGIVVSGGGHTTCAGVGCP